VPWPAALLAQPKQICLINLKGILKMKIKQYLLSGAMLLALTAAANANIIQSFGVDPTSATGAFNHSLGTSTAFFDDQYTFTLDSPMTLTIASVTNVFAQPTDFISGFTGAVFEGTPALPGAEVIGPVLATSPCQFIALCQGFAGSAVLGAGSYFLDISGTAGGSSGYGGNLATFAAVPGPVVGSGMTGLFAMVLGLAFAGLSRLRKARNNGAFA
jgi:hypothetical protein